MKIRFTHLITTVYAAAGVVMAILTMAAALCPADELSLYDAARIALRENPLLEAEQMKAQAAEEKIVQARSGLLPQVMLSEQATRTTNPMWVFGSRLNQQAITAMDFDPNRLNDPDALANYATVLAIDWPLYDSGQTWQGIQQARISSESATFLLRKKRQDVMAETAIAYLQTLLSIKNEHILERMLDTAVSHEKMIASRYNGGFVAKSDFLRAQVRISDLKQRISQAGNLTQISFCRLNTYMGAESQRQHQMTTQLQAGEAISGSVDEWIAAARGNRPDLQQAELMQRFFESELEKSKSARLPSVGVSSNYEINSEDFDHTASNYTIGVQISLPIFSGGRVSSKIRESTILVRQSHMRLQSMDQQVCAETRAAFLSAESAWARIAVAHSTIAQSEESMRIVRSRYQSGLFTITDLLEAELMLQQSLTDHLTAVHDFLAAVVRLTQSAGIAGNENEILRRALGQ